MRTVNVVLRVVAAVAALVAGYAHLKLYNDGYKDIPAGNIWIVGDIGHQFLLNAVVALLIALALVLPLLITQLPSWLWKLAAVAGLFWSITSIIAFFMARSDNGWFSYTDQPGLKPSPEAAMAVFGEIVVAFCCLVLLVVAFMPRDTASAPPATAAPTE